MRNAAIKEYKCVIRIGAEGDESSRISHGLSEKLREKYGEDILLPVRCNYTEHYIKQQIDYCMKDYKPVRVYVTDYHERQGSLAISFNLLVVSAVRNYGEIHETLNLELEKLSVLFQSLLEAGHPVRHSLMQSGMVMLENSLAWPEQPRNTARKWLPLLVGIALGMLCWSIIQNRGEENKVRTIVKKEIEKYHSLDQRHLPGVKIEAQTEKDVGAGR